MIQSLVDRGCDSLVVFPVRGSLDDLRAVADGSFPVVTIDLPIDHPGIGSVESTSEQGSHLAVEHLRSRCRHVRGMVSSPNRKVTTEPRERGFRDAIAAPGLDTRHHVVSVDETIEGGAAGVRPLVDRFPDLDGLLAYSDIMAIGAIRELEDIGRRVPHDVAVIGVDDIALSALVRPALTSIRVDREQMGTRAVEMLMQMRDNPDTSPRRDVVEVTLVVRSSA